MKTLFKDSLARRILVSMILLALAPLVIMAVQGLHCSRQAIAELEYTHLQSVLAGREAQVKAWLEERESDLKLSCFMSCAHEGCTGLANHMSAEHFDAIRGNLDLFELDRPLYESLAVYDANWRRLGRKLSSTHEGHGDLLDDVLKEQLTTATGIVASATHAHVDNHFGLHIGYPLRGFEDDRQGYIVVNVNLADTLNAILGDRTGLGRTGRLYLVSEEGEYLTCPEPGLGLIGHTVAAPGEVLRPQGNRVFTYADHTGTKVLGSSTRIPKFNWVLVAEIAEEEAMGWLAVLGARAITTGLATLVVVLLLAGRFSRKLADPMRVLAETARRITTGSHQDRVPELPESEAREVGHAFNEMLDALTLAQQEMVQSASLAAIGELSASVVHEMRNPLSSIKINLQALRKKVQGDANYAELADIASNQALRLEHMLSELLQFGKPIALSFSDVSFAELTDEAIAGLHGLAEAKDLRLRVENELRGRRLRVDREHVRRALENVVKNAIEASPKGGSILIEAGVSDSEDAFASIKVRDAGPGIPESILPRLFQPFVTTRGEGTGLGLANVKKIAEMHEGDVHATNLSEGGALFELLLPLKRRQYEQDPDHR